MQANTNVTSSSDMWFRTAFSNDNDEFGVVEVYQEDNGRNFVSIVVDIGRPSNVNDEWFVMDFIVSERGTGDGFLVFSSIYDDQVT